MASKKISAKKEAAFAGAMMKAMSRDNIGNIRGGSARKSATKKKK